MGHLCEALWKLAKFKPPPLHSEILLLQRVKERLSDYRQHTGYLFVLKGPNHFDSIGLFQKLSIFPNKSRILKMEKRPRSLRVANQEKGLVLFWALIFFFSVILCCSELPQTIFELELMHFNKEQESFSLSQLTDFYYKPTDSHRYLDSTSSYPASYTDSIPYSQFPS